MYTNRVGIIEIRRQTATSYDGAGGREYSEAFLFESSAEIQTSRSQRKTDNAQDIISPSKTFRVRYIPSRQILQNDIVVYLGKRYIIDSIDFEDERKKFQLLKCSGDGQS